MSDVELGAGEALGALVLLAVPGVAEGAAGAAVVVGVAALLSPGLAASVEGAALESAAFFEP